MYAYMHMRRFNYELPLPVWEAHVHEEAVTGVKVGHLAGSTVRILTSSEKEARVWEVTQQHMICCLYSHPERSTYVSNA